MPTAPVRSDDSLFECLRSAFEGSPAPLRAERLHWIRRLLAREGWRHPRRLDAATLHRFLAGLPAADAPAAAASLLALYRALDPAADEDRLAHRLGLPAWPRPPSEAEADRLIAALAPLPAALCALVRETGVGLAALLRTRVGDVAGAGDALRVVPTPGASALVLPLPEGLATSVARLLVRARSLHELDQDAGLAPPAFPRTPLLPARRLGWCPRTGRLRRGPLAEAAVEARVAAAAHRAGLAGPVRTTDLQAQWLRSPRAREASEEERARRLGLSTGGLRLQEAALGAGSGAVGETERGGLGAPSRRRPVDPPPA
ncbi:MAG: hypothetical protein V2J02_04600 [Pseudomonadales bacterium]|jgi:hypothetical protein|nr:hypothetical protein [Pseudomonadales bacterium]